MTARDRLTEFYQPGTFQEWGFTPITIATILAWKRRNCPATE